MRRLHSQQGCKSMCSLKVPKLQVLDDSGRLMQDWIAAIRFCLAQESYGSALSLQAAVGRKVHVAQQLT